MFRKRIWWCTVTKMDLCQLSQFKACFALPSNYEWKTTKNWGFNAICHVLSAIFTILLHLPVLCCILEYIKLNTRFHVNAKTGWSVTTGCLIQRISYWRSKLETKSEFFMMHSRILIGRTICLHSAGQLWTQRLRLQTFRQVNEFVNIIVSRYIDYNKIKSSPKIL